MDRHKMEQLEDKVGELLRFGSSSCVRQANAIMIAEFENLLYFALDFTDPKPKPKHTIADNYPAGGLTASEPCAFCVDYEKLEEKIEQLQAKLDAEKQHSKIRTESCNESNVKVEQLLTENEKFPETFLKLAEEHYWDTFEDDIDIIISHIKSLLNLTKQSLKESD